MKYIFADMKKIALILTLLIGTTAFGNETPGFEFCINGKIYTSQDPVWSHAGSSEKTLSNGGIRTTYHIKGTKALRGLEILWDKETFGDNKFVRERLRMRSSEGRKFRLTNFNGKNHFVFPKYSFKSSSAPSATDIRI
jgi:hypothetical protein